MDNRTMLLIHEKSTGNIVGTNSTEGATFDNVYPDVSIEFKEKYDGVVVDYDKDIESNPSKYVVADNTVVLRDSPLISNELTLLNPTEQRLIDIELAIASILGGA